MDLSQLKRFVTTVEGGSLGKAAEMLNISQPGLSKSIHQLEADFGAKLLDRGPKGVTSTAFGEAVYLRAKRILAEWRHLENEIKACLKPVYSSGKVIKVIVESGILTDSELIDCCKLYSEHKIDFMKTSTGFSEFGASVHTVNLMRENLPLRIGIKASGGVRSYQFARELINAGATRLGCSASMQIMKESREDAG